VNGSTLEDKGDATQLIPQRPFLFWSKGPDGFYDLAESGAAGSALQRAIVGRGAACADFDRDGDLDAIIMTNHGRPLLLRNDGGNRNHWLTVRLVGTRSNRSGYGAKLYLTAGGKRQLRQYGVGGSYLSQCAPEAWFGLGRNARAELIEVLWPSGARQAFKDLPAGRAVTITENDPHWQEVPRQPNPIRPSHS
jgi:enediyne biosynthesis protein E4